MDIYFFKNTLYNGYSRSFSAPESRALPPAFLRGRISEKLQVSFIKGWISGKSASQIHARWPLTCAEQLLGGKQALARDVFLRRDAHRVFENAEEIILRKKKRTCNLLHVSDREKILIDIFQRALHDRKPLLRRGEKRSVRHLRIIKDLAEKRMAKIRENARIAFLLIPPKAQEVFDDRWMRGAPENLSFFRNACRNRSKRVLGRDQAVIPLVWKRRIELQIMMLCGARDDQIVGRNGVSPILDAGKAPSLRDKKKLVAIVRMRLDHGGRTLQIQMVEGWRTHKRKQRLLHKAFLRSFSKNRILDFLSLVKRFL